MLVRTLWLSFEPAQRGWLNDVRSYVPPVAIGEVMRSWGVGQVIASGHPDFEPGQFVHGTLHWQTHALLDLTADTNPPSELAPIPPEVHDPKLMLSIAGVTGMTAYFGMRYVGQPVAGDTVLVTAAAGATGSVAGQVARNLGAARVIGTAGSTDKRAGSATSPASTSVSTTTTTTSAGGSESWRPTATTSCSTTSVGRCSTRRCSTSPNTADWPCAGRSPPAIAQRNRRSGCTTTNCSRPAGHGWRASCCTTSRTASARRDARCSAGTTDGSLHVEHDILEGLENAPLGLRRLFDGGNLGKQILHVADPA